MSHEETINWFREQDKVPTSIYNPDLWPPWCDSIGKRKEFLVQIVCDFAGSTAIFGLSDAPSPKLVRRLLRKSGWDYMTAIMQLV